MRGRTKYNIHSPFVHSFIEKILDDKQIYYNYLPVEQLRQLMLNQNKDLEIKDYGAGSKFSNSKKITLKKITKKVQSSSEKGQLLFRIINYFGSKNILEIGTSLGLTTSYLANANKKASVTTIEGDPVISNIAKNNFKKLKLSNVKLINNQFDVVLPALLENKFDFIFFDGNHTKEATLKYFLLAKERSNPNSIFIFDDIYWSNEMKDAWEIIIKDQKVTLSIDLFSIGLIFFLDKNQIEHFRLIHASNFY